MRSAVPAGAAVQPDGNDDLIAGLLRAFQPAMAASNRVARRAA